MPVIAVSFGILWAVTCLYALVRGGSPERLAATLFVAGALGTPLVDSPHSALYQGIEWGVLGIDAAMLLILVPLALATTRFWPLLMTSFQLAQVGTHLAAWLAPDALPKGYYAMTVWWSYPMLGLLFAATCRHRGRQAAYGIDPSWLRSLPDDYRTGTTILSVRSNPDE